MARKLWRIARFVAALSIVSVIWNVLWLFNFHQTQNRTSFLPVEKDGTVKSDTEDIAVELTKNSPASLPLRRVTLSAVTCGNRVNETLVLLKSALIFSKSFFNFIIFADDAAMVELRQRVDHWPQGVRARMNLDLRPITFPDDQRAEEWRKLFKPCASQRLFLPGLLKDVDSLLYMDTDTLFLASPDLIWDYFSKMDSQQMAALAPEHEDPATGWYNRFARHPYYGNLGVNSGVMLMNLTRMRAFQWEQYIIPIYQEYKTKITWGDQDIINILFHFHPQKLYVYPCHINYRPDHCMYMSVCKPAEEHGIYVLHGNRGSFHNEKQPAFKAIYNAMNQFQFGTDLKSGLLGPMNAGLQSTWETTCGRLQHLFTKVLANMTRD